jgi:excisionase family DNA binding protein
LADQSGQGRDPDIMTAKETAVWLGLNENTVRKAAAAGNIPGMKAGGSWLFSKSGIKQYMSQPHPLPGEDRAAEADGAGEGAGGSQGIGRRATRRIRSAASAGGSAGETP